MTLAQVRSFALALPEVTEQPHFELWSFRVRGKIFATVPPDEEHLHLFVAEDLREVALAAHPGFLEELLWGGRVVGLRVVLARARPEVVTELLEQAWSHKAPKRLRRAPPEGTEI